MDTAEHHVLRLTLAHRCSSQARQTSGTPQDGNRLGLGVTLQRGTAVLARLGEPEPAAILAGAVSAHFAVTNANVRLDIDEAQILARRALGEAAYRAALGRGAVMEDDEVVGYALGELQRLSDRPMPQ
jgi:hypothetical protein